MSHSVYVEINIPRTSNKLFVVLLSDLLMPDATELATG